MGLFSGFFSKNKSFNEKSEDIKIKNQILEQPNANQASDSYLNDTGNYKYNVETVPASDIDMSTAMGMDSPEFWNHKNNTKEDYMNLASKLPQVQDELNSGKTLDEIKENPELRDCASAYYNPDKMVKIRENDNGDYEFEDDGRHRVTAAQELGYDIPIQNRSKPVQEQAKNEDDYTYNPEDKSFENNAALEDEIVENDSKNDISDGNHYMSDDEDNGYSPVKTMDGIGNNYVPSEEMVYDNDGNSVNQETPEEESGVNPENEQDAQQEQPEELDFEEGNQETPEEENGVNPENEQDAQQEQPEELDFEEGNQETPEEESGVNPENEQDAQQEQPEELDFEEGNQETPEEENGVNPENEQDAQQEQPEELDFEEGNQETPEEENGVNPENEQDAQQEQPEELDFEEGNQETPEEENGVNPENEQDAQQEQPEQAQDIGQDINNSDGPSYSDADAGDSMTEDNSMGI